MTMAAGAEPLVVGLGSPDRGDDGVGPTVAGAIADLGLAGVRVASHEDPTDLIHLWKGADVAVVIDAVMSGHAPGEIVLLEVGRRERPLPESSWAQTGRGGTHAFGLAAAVELSRALGHLPPRVVLVGIEAASFDHGAPLSPRVRAAVGAAVAHVRAVLS
jgi:hydrogenase maturation protease